MAYAHPLQLSSAPISTLPSAIPCPDKIRPLFGGSSCRGINLDHSDAELGMSCDQASNARSDRCLVSSAPINHLPGIARYPILTAAPRPAGLRRDALVVVARPRAAAPPAVGRLPYRISGLRSEPSSRSAILRIAIDDQLDQSDHSSFYDRGLENLLHPAIHEFRLGSVRVLSSSSRLTTTAPGESTRTT